jgi:integrase
MARKVTQKDQDRYLQLRAGNYQYSRKVPTSVAHLDDRAPLIRQSLKTTDLALARAKRDLLEEADDLLWASSLVGAPKDPARQRHQIAMRRAEALGFTYRPAHVLAATASIEDIRERFDAFSPSRMPAPTGHAIVGMVETPAVTVSEAFDIYVDEIVPDELLNKSEAQRAQWKKVKQRAVNNFIELVGDKAMIDINRDDALKLHTLWRKRIAPKDRDVRASHSASSGNRDIGNMRVLYDAYFSHVGDHDRVNPFARLSFKVSKKRSRPPFPTDWITGTIMRPGAMATLNDQARAIVLVLIETGARPSEIANLRPETIRLQHHVPHIAIEPHDDPDDPREIKTASSERIVPLVGVALAAMQRHPAGFPRYRNRENHLSGALNKYFQDNGLFPSAKHKIYSFRHSFEDRMKEAGLDDELRKMMMGHTIDRPHYGSGGSLKWRLDELRRIELPFDPVIV